MVGCELQPTHTTTLPTAPASVNVHFDQAHHNSESKSKKNKSGITGRVIGINFVKPLETEFFFKEKLYLLDPIRSPFRSELVHGVKLHSSHAAAPAFWVPVCPYVYSGRVDKQSNFPLVRHL